jgi:hypothetical protein
MRQGRSESWRFVHDFDQILHAVLYVRDCLGLDVEEAGGIPPRLAGDIPDRSGLLDSVGRHEVIRDWPNWWNRAVVERATTQLGRRGVERGPWPREVDGRHRQVADPLEWSALSGQPALQEAARKLYIEGCQWFGSARRPFLPPLNRDIFNWELVRDSAEATAADHGVSVGAINGCAFVLVVEGSWWELVSPGVVLCSVAAATAPDSTVAILEDVLASPLGD